MCTKIDASLKKLFTCQDLKDLGTQSGKLIVSNHTHIMLYESGNALFFFHYFLLNSDLIR